MVTMSSLKADFTVFAIAINSLYITISLGKAMLCQLYLDLASVHGGFIELLAQPELEVRVLERRRDVQRPLIAVLLDILP